MQWTIDARAWRDAYGRLETIAETNQAAYNLKGAADDMEREARAAAKANRLELDPGDAAEAFVGVCLWFLVTSNPALADVIPGAVEGEGSVPNRPAMHLLPLRGGKTACGAVGESTAEINEVTCPECLAIHEDYMAEQSED